MRPLEEDSKGLEVGGKSGSVKKMLVREQPLHFAFGEEFCEHLVAFEGRPLFFEFLKVRFEAFHKFR